MGKYFENVETAIEENKNLINYVLNKNFPSRRFDDDLKQIGLIALWRAAENYEEGAAKFSTFAVKYIKNAIIKELQKESARKRVLEGDTMQVCLDDDFIENVVGRDYIPFMMLQIKEYKEKLTKRKKDILEMYLAGYSIEEIANKLGCKKTTVYNERNEVREGLKKLC